MKRIVSVILAVCIGMLGSFALFGCNKKSGNADGGGQEGGARRYYLYNVESDVFDRTEYLDIDGGSCSLVKNTDGITVTKAGTVSFSGDAFTLTCDGELLGISITTVMRGEREDNGVLRVDSETVIGLTSTPATDNDVMYYCPDGVKPLSPTALYTVTFDGNGGSFDGETRRAVKTKADGTVTLPAPPTRDGYDFVGYFANKTSGSTPVSSSTPFDHSMTVYARWTERTVVVSKYYAYDPETQTFDLNDYMEFSGASVSAVAVEGSTTVRNNGTVVFDGNNFTVTMTQELLGITVTNVMCGVRENNGVLRFESQTISGVGVTDVIESVFYYCPNSVKPINPVIEEKIFEITFNAAPGKFSDNTQTKTVTTNRDGKLTLPENPTRNGYKFKGFADLYDDFVTADTVFRRNTTVNAVFVKLHTVTFKVEGETVETRQVEEGAPLGEIKLPSNISDIMIEHDYHMFKGWRVRNGYKYYTSTTTVSGDVTLEAEFYDMLDADIYIDQIKQWSEVGHLYIHYLKTDAEPHDLSQTVNKDNLKYRGPEYVDWLLWAWPRNGEGRAFEPIRIGMYGIVFDIDMKRTYTDGGWDALTTTHESKTVNYFDKDIGITFFDDKSRQNGDRFWKNDGGNIMLNISPVFEYWDIDEYGNRVGDIMYLFDQNMSVHLCFTAGHIDQQSVDNHMIWMMVYDHDNDVLFF